MLTAVTADTQKTSSKVSFLLTHAVAIADDVHVHA